MSESKSPRRQLPAHPSQEHLRKQAKRLVKMNASLKLSEAQHQLATQHGCADWAELMRTVDVINHAADPSEQPATHLPAELRLIVQAIHADDSVEMAKWLDQDPSLIDRKLPKIAFGNLPFGGGTLLHYAVDSEKPDCVSLLLDRGADVNATTEIMNQTGRQTPLFHAVFNANVELTTTLINRGADVFVIDAQGNTPLWTVCSSWAAPDKRIAVAELLLHRKAPVRHACENNTTALHQAARMGPIGMVELLIRNGAKEWQADKQNKRPIDYARQGNAADKDAIITLLDRPVITDPLFRSAVVAIHTGDLPALRTLLQENPTLSRDRAIEPDCYPPSYFSNPKLLWFVANNPTLSPKMPANLVDLTQAIINAGVVKEDLDFTMELVMSSSAAKQQGQQIPLMKILLEHGAAAGDLLVAMAHGEMEPVKFLISQGVPLTAPTAAGLGLVDDLNHLLSIVDAQTRQTAFGIAVINRRHEAARLCLDAGADVNALLPVHSHSTAAHQASVNDDVSMLQLLIEHHARLDVRDTLWNATPLAWAVHTKKPAAEAFLRSISQSSQT